jgi:hypothetical protein
MEQEDDLIWGCRNIAAEIKRSERATFGLLKAKKLPAKKVGKQYVAGRRALKRSLLVDDRLGQ